MLLTRSTTEQSANTLCPPGNEQEEMLLSADSRTQTAISVHKIDLFCEL